MIEGYESRWHDDAGTRVHYLHRDGDGPPLVFISGGVVDSVMLTWKSVLAALPAGYRVYAIDLPGYGKSEPSGDFLSTRGYAGLIRGFLLRYELEGAVLFATSMSGAIALDIAPLGGPDKHIRALVLSGAYGMQPRAPMHPLAYALSRVPGIDRFFRSLARTRAGMRIALRFVVGDPSDVTAELVDDALGEARRPDALEAFVRWLQHEMTPTHVQSNFRRDLTRIRLPVLMIHGTRDWLMPLRFIREAAELLPNADLHVFEAGHMVPRERTHDVMAAITDFLKRLDT